MNQEVGIQSEMLKIPASLTKDILKNFNERYIEKLVLTFLSNYVSIIKIFKSIRDIGKMCKLWVCLYPLKSV